MDFGPLGPLLVIYGLLAARVVLQLIQRWPETWDADFTPADRSLVDQAAFFVLVPVSVALHELGHAVMVKVFGGEILDWGYYGFAGFVGYDPRPVPLLGQLAITAAGTVVNILLAAVALWLVYRRTPPMRAAFNELLLQFVTISLLNALLFYPLLDLSSGMDGDWSQMYRSGVPWFTALVIAVQVAILGGMWWARRNPVIQRRTAELTGRGPRVHSAAMLARSPVRSGVRQMPPAQPAARSRGERLFIEAGERVSAGWPASVESAVHLTPDGALLALQWRSEGLQRAVIARVAGEALEISGGVAADGEPPVRRGIARSDAIPTADELTIDLRLAMEQVDRWTLAAAAAT
ncbi:MAG: hypothetical protein ACKOWF_03610 [Chloroflexota bacterium]